MEGKDIKFAKQQYKKAVEMNNFDWFKRNIEKGKISIDDLLQYEIMTQDEVDKYLIDKAEHFSNIKNGKYDNEKISELLFLSIITENELICKKILTKDELDIAIRGRKEVLPLPEMSIDDIPPLAKNRTDIFTLGVRGSGKSMFIASLIYYAIHKDNAMYAILSTNIGGLGRQYCDIMQRSIIENRTLEPVSPASFYCMTIDYKDEQGRRHPLTFFETGGENTEFFAGMDNINNPKVREYFLDNPNNKILFLAVDSLESPNQAYTLIRALNLLDAAGTLKTVNAIAILLTKWDKHSNENPAEFLKTHYKPLYTVCKDIEEKYSEMHGFIKKRKVYKLKFKVFTFSVGNFNEQNSIYIYDDTDTKGIHDWLLSVTPYN